MVLRANPNVVPGFEVDEEIIGGETRVSKLKIIVELETKRDGMFRGI
jgi:hypothetical protein